MDERTARELLSEIARQLQPIAELSQEIVIQADIQSYTERLYNQLVALSYEGIALMKQLQEGQAVSQTWIAQRDDLIHRAEKLISDVPDSSQE